MFNINSKLDVVLDLCLRVSRQHLVRLNTTMHWGWIERSKVTSNFLLDILLDCAISKELSYVLRVLLVK